MPSRHSNPVHGGGDEEARKAYPYQSGDVTVLGPEIFASADGGVICWRGRNYEPQMFRAGERADAIPERRTYRNVDAFEMDDGTVYVKSSQDRIPERYVRAAQPEAGNEEGERLRERVASLMLDEPSKTAGLYAAIDELQREVARLRAAHPEADRAPEDER